MGFLVHPDINMKDNDQTKMTGIEGWIRHFPPERKPEPETQPRNLIDPNYVVSASARVVRPSPAPGYISWLSPRSVDGIN